MSNFLTKELIQQRKKQKKPAIKARYKLVTPNMYNSSIRNSDFTVELKKLPDFKYMVSVYKIIRNLSPQIKQKFIILESQGVISIDLTNQKLVIKLKILTFAENLREKLALFPPLFRTVKILQGRQKKLRVYSVSEYKKKLTK